jgi:hypothetical protein
MESVAFEAIASRPDRIHVRLEPSGCNSLTEHPAGPEKLTTRRLLIAS